MTIDVPTVKPVASIKTINIPQKSESSCGKKTRMEKRNE
jgi:hypothetical protein